ncbi:MAG: efflux RND transporter permease subunit [Candidatus Marinimicrobia bacterium]|nr:efflux RND transporter permease subunit [Candidatus Neomarinimicrobiota bacterium]
MKLSQVSIRRGVTFAMIYLIAVGFGIFGLLQLRLDLYPDIQFPLIGAITQYEGVGPEDIETLVTRPIEEAVVSVEGVKRVTSQSMSGSSIIFIEFDWGTDMDVAEQNVRKQIDLIRDYFPDEVSQPLTFAFNPSMQPIVFMSATADQLGEAELRKLLLEQAEPRLERLPGVASITTVGGLEREIQVSLNPYQLAANGITVEQIQNALTFSNLEVPGGMLEEGTREFSVKTDATFNSVDQIGNTVVGYSKTGTPIYLKNVATVTDGFKEIAQVIRTNQQNALMMMAYKQTDANTVQATEAVLNALPDLEKRLGNGLKFNVLFDQAKFINQSISNLSSTVIQAFILSGLVLFFFLRHWRSAAIVSVSIPVSIVVTFFIMARLGITLNIISMAGLALSIGLLVDNSIVVLENIFRRQQSGERIRVASENGASEVGMAITASTLTTLAVFVPILFVPGIAGQLFKDMALTIVVSLVTSLLVALTLIPLMASRLLSRKQQTHKWSMAVRLDNGIGHFLVRLIDVYERTLHFALTRPKTIIFSILGIFVITLALGSRLGGEFIPEADQGMISMDISTEVGTSLPQTDEIFARAEQIVHEEVPEAENIYISFGTATGFGVIFGSNASNKGSMMIRLSDKDERERSQFEIQDVLRERFAELPGIKMNFQQGGPAMGGGGAVQVKIFGHDLDAAKNLAYEVEEIMENIEGLVDINLSFSLPQPEYQIHIDRDRAAALGLNVSAIARTVSTAIKGSIATRYREGGDEYNVVVRYDRAFRSSEVDLSRVYISTPTGEQIPLNNVASIVAGDGPVKIDREDQSRLVTVNANNSGRDLQSITNDLNAKLETLPLPPDFRIEIGGTAKDLQESFMYLGLAILAAIILVFMVMAAQFESFLDPFIILFTVPLALIGVIWALLLTGTNMGITVMIGAMLLVGVVVNNAIVLIDFINQIIGREDITLVEAIVKGGRLRLRPILMTALTTILSLLPLSLGFGSGAEIWAPMARSVIGGMTVSTFLTLIFIPTLYLLMTRKRFSKKQVKMSDYVASQEMVK